MFKNSIFVESGIFSCWYKTAYSHSGSDDKNANFLEVQLALLCK